MKEKMLLRLLAPLATPTSSGVCLRANMLLLLF